MGVNDADKKLTVGWLDIESELGYKAKSITFDTYLKWRQEAPDLPRKND